MATISMITVDTLDELAASAWWRERLNGEYLGQYPGFTMLSIPGFSARLGFQKVETLPEVKNRIHLDLEAEIDRETSLKEFISAGATLVEAHDENPDFGWSVLKDPFGIVFCVSDPHGD